MWQRDGGAAAGSLETLEFVQGSVELAIYSGLISGELGEGVGTPGVLDKSLPEGGSFTAPQSLHLLGSGEGFSVLLLVGYLRGREQRIYVAHVATLFPGIAASLFVSSLCHLPVELVDEYPHLDPAQTPEPPVGGDDLVDQKVLEYPDGLKLCPQVLAQLPQGTLVFSRQEDLLGEDAVPQGIQADSLLPLRCPGPVLLRAFWRLAWIFFSLVMASTLHNIRVYNVEEIVEQGRCTSTPDFLSPDQVG